MIAESLPPVATTPIAERIRMALTITQRMNWISSIQGAPGIGKTTAARKYRTEATDVWWFTVRPDTASTSRLFRSLTLEFIGSNLQDTDRNFRELAYSAKTFSAAGRVLLILDEAQNLKADALEMLRALHDDGGFSLAFVGNHTFADRHSADRVSRVTTPQFRSRLQLIEDLPGLDEASALAVARAHGITDDLSARRAAKVALGARGLRIIEGVARAARELAGADVPNADHFQTALNLLSPTS